MPLTMKHRTRRSSSRSLPELQTAAEAVLARLTSNCSQRSYRSAIKHFVRWYCASPKLAFDRRTVVAYVAELEERRLAPSTIGVRESAKVIPNLLRIHSTGEVEVERLKFKMLIFSRFRVLQGLHISE